MSTTVPTPMRWLEVLAAQVRVAFLSRRRGQMIFLAFVLTQVVALAGFGVVLGLTISTGGEETTVAMASVEEFESAMGFSADRAVSGLGVAFHIGVVFALFFPFAVWSEEQPSRRGYHWAMPVDRRGHDLARVVAGAVLLLGTLTVVYGVSVLVSVLSGSAQGLSSLSPAFWLTLFLGPLVPYALNSIFVVRCEHPAGWFWGGVGVIALTSTFSNLAGLDRLNSLLTTVLGGPLGLVQAIVGPVWAGWAARPAATGLIWFAGWAIWMSLLCIAIVLAASTRSKTN